MSTTEQTLKNCCGGLLSIDCTSCDGHGQISEEAGNEGMICPECNGLKITPCLECSSPTYSQLFGELKRKAFAGAFESLPIRERTSSLHQ